MMKQLSEFVVFCWDLRNGFTHLNMEAILRNIFLIIVTEVVKSLK